MVQRAGWVMMLCALLGAAGRPQDVAIVVNPANPVASLDENGARRFLLLETALWPNGKRVRPVDRQEKAPERQVVLDQLLHLGAQELAAYWVQRRFSEGIAPPARVNSSLEVVEYVAAYDGAIGFVDVSTLSPAQRARVKVVLVVRKP